jgi:hypothetical protein
MAGRLHYHIYLLILISTVPLLYSRSSQSLIKFSSVFITTLPTGSGEMKE